MDDNSWEALGYGALIAAALAAVYWMSAKPVTKHLAKGTSADTEIDPAPTTKPVSSSATPTPASMLGRLEPTWQLMIVVALIAGIAGGLVVHAMSPDKKQENDSADDGIAERALHKANEVEDDVSSLRSRVDDLEYKLRTHEH